MILLIAFLTAALIALISQAHRRVQMQRIAVPVKFQRRRKQ